MASRGLIAIFQGHFKRGRPTFTRLSHRFYASAAKAAQISLEGLPQPPPIRLREYQEECIQAVLENLEIGRKRLGISLATGSGKTVIFTQLIDRIKPRSPDADQTLILVHRRELVEQAARHCRLAYPHKTIDIEMGANHASGHADITVASVQSIISGDRMLKFDPTRFKLILVDEAHHIVARGYLETLAHFGLSEAQPDSPVLVGVSATLSRADGLRLGAAIDYIAYHKDYVDMIGEKWLADVIFTTVQSNADISKVKKGANGDFAASDLSRVVNTEDINNATVRAWLHKASGRKSTIVFCVDLEHVAGLTNAFRRYGIDARFVTGDTPKVERAKRLDDFRNGEYPVIVNCGVYTEGTDIPNIDCVLLARPTRSQNLLVQMIGRGMRLHPGKVNCHIIDMVASLATGIVSSPTLFGLDPSEMVENANVDDMKELKEKKEKEAERDEIAQRTEANPTGAKFDGVATKFTFTDYDSVYDLIKDESGDRHIRAISEYSWVEVDRQKYILSSAGLSFLRIEKVGSMWSVQHVQAMPKIKMEMSKTKVPFYAPQELAATETSTAAIHAADTWASRHLPHNIISKRADWRKRPATEGQLILINKMRPKDDQLTSADVTKGKAGDMITKLKHGARGRFSRNQIVVRKIIKQASKENTIKERETVVVGPLS